MAPKARLKKEAFAVGTASVASFFKSSALCNRRKAVSDNEAFALKNRGRAIIRIQVDAVTRCHINRPGEKMHDGTLRFRYEYQSTRKNCAFKHNNAKHQKSKILALGPAIKKSC